MNDNINKTVNEILESYSKHEQTCRLSEDNIINKSVLIQVLEEIRKLLFPGYFDKNRVREEYIGYIVGDRIEFIQYNLKKQIAKALKGCEKCNDLSYDEVMEKSEKLVYEFLSKIPSIRDYLATDVVAASAVAMQVYSVTRALSPDHDVVCPEISPQHYRYGRHSARTNRTVPLSPSVN